MLNNSFPSWPSFTEEEADAVREVLLSNRVNYWTGQEAREFEKEFAAWVGTGYAVALANGTVALDLALKALNVTIGDEVIVTSRTFLASASCIVNAGAVPVFADVDLDSQNITVDTIRTVITTKTKAIICVHLAGWPCNMDAIMALAEQHNLYVIEDCAQAHGAKYKGQSVGSFGHIGTWSFCQDKIMTTGGEGGMVTTNDRALWSIMWSYKDHGKSWAAIYEREHEPGFRWLHESFGTNWRMTEIQAVIGRIQLRKLVEWTAKRQRNAKLLCNSLLGLNVLRIPWPAEHVQHAFYRFYTFVRPEYLRPCWSRDRIMMAIQDVGIPCTIGSCPEIYLEKAFQSAGLQPANRLPQAQELGETSLAFLVHPTLSEEATQKTADVIFTILQEATEPE